MKYTIFTHLILMVAFAIANLNMQAVDSQRQTATTVDKESLAQQTLETDHELHVTIDDKNNIEIACDEQKATVTKEQLEQSLTFKNMFGDVQSSDVAQAIQSLFVNVTISNEAIIHTFKQLEYVEQINNAAFEDDKKTKRKALAEQLQQYKNQQLVSIMEVANYLDIEELIDGSIDVLARRFTADKTVTNYQEDKEQFLALFDDIPNDLKIKIQKKLFQLLKLTDNTPHILYQQYVTCPEIKVLKKKNNAGLFRWLWLWLDFSNAVNVATFNHDGTRAATTYWSKPPRPYIWDVKTGKCIHTLSGHTDFIYSLKFSPDGSLIATRSKDKTVRIWEVKTGKCLHTIFSQEWSEIHSVTFSHDSSYIVTSSYDLSSRFLSSKGSARVWNVQTGEEVIFLKHDNKVKYAAFNHDGTQIVTVEDDIVHESDKVHIWDIDTNRLMYNNRHIRTLNPSYDHFTLSPTAEGPARYQRRTTLAKFNHNGKLLVTASHYSVPFFTERADTQMNYYRTGEGVIGLRGTAYIWDVKTGQCIQKLSDQFSINHAEFNHDGTQLLTLSTFGGIIRIWDIETGKRLQSIKGTVNVNLSVNLNWDESDHKYFLIGNGLWGKLDPQIYRNGTIGSAHFNHDSTLILTLELYQARIYKTSTGQCINELKLSDRVNAAHFNHNGTQVITGSMDGAARIWDIKPLYDMPLTFEEVLHLSRIYAHLKNKKQFRKVLLCEDKLDAILPKHLQDWYHNKWVNQIKSSTCKWLVGLSAAGIVGYIAYKLLRKNNPHKSKNS